MDAFTDNRRGFDLIVGNPPWAKIKTNDDEFFTKHDPVFRSLDNKTEKNKLKKKLLKNSIVEQTYREYRESASAKSKFYSAMFKLQGAGDKDLWRLMLERTVSLLSKGGTISMIIPSQLLTNISGVDMRKHLLDYEIKSLYVFENKKKIFPIDSRYRFTLLTVRNNKPTAKFSAAFYLHELSSLEGITEQEKFCTVSKQDILDSFPNDFIIPEVGDEGWQILRKFTNNKTLRDGIDGWSISLSHGLHKAKNSGLLIKTKTPNKKYWPVLEGKYIHQFLHNYTAPKYVVDSSKGLQVESKKTIFGKLHKEFYNSYRLAFRNISSPTNMRTIIAALIPPRVFHTNSLFQMVLKYNDVIAIDSTQKNICYKKIAYIAGILNSMTFDFLTRITAQLTISTIIKSIPIPNSSDQDKIIKLVVKLSSGDKEFAEFVESFGIENIRLEPEQRVESAARLDALVAHAYGLKREEYETVIKSFDLKDDGLPMFDKNHKADWSKDTKTMRRFFGKISSKALDHYDEIAKGKKIE